MLESLEAQVVYPQGKLYLDYVSGRGSAASFFSHPVDGFTTALAARSDGDYPREEVCDLLETYNARLKADPAAQENIAALRERSTFCVISGQQVGFLGGPVYTLYKILTTIRLAHSLQTRFRARIVPLFWLASEDHDFTEINHAHLLKRDGEVGTVRFEWEGRGRPIADLPVSDEVLRAYHTYFEALPPGPYHGPTRELFAPKSEEDYCTWHARLWSRLFSNRGLIIIEPSILRGQARAFFHTALKEHAEIQGRLEEVAVRLCEAGYPPALSPERAGRLYTFDSDRRRVRVEDPSTHHSKVKDQPERYSADTALRPLYADTLLPIVASVLGSGEIAYHAMLKPLYPLFHLSQPLLFPRKSYTVITREEADLIAHFRTSAAAILAGAFDSQQALHTLAPRELQDRFAGARATVSQALAGLLSTLTELDPSLERSWAQTRSASLRSLARLEERALRVELAKHGLSPRLFQRLRNCLLPRGKLQERIFPLPYFINRHGPGFVDRLFPMGELDDFSHHVITLEDDDG